MEIPTGAHAFIKSAVRGMNKAPGLGGIQGRGYPVWVLRMTWFHQGWHVLLYPLGFAAISNRSNSD